jgi:hypothetical protein
MRLLGHSDLAGHGDSSPIGGETPDWDANKSVWCHGIIVQGDRAYVAHEDEKGARGDLPNLSCDGSRGCPQMTIENMPG